MDILGVKPETWFPIITLVLGIFLKGINDLIFDARKAKREKEARLELRLDTLNLRKIEFQRASLLDLQAAMQKLARATGKGHYDDLMAFQESGEWGKNSLSEEANEGAFQAQTSLLALRVRVDDSEIRELADAFSFTCNHITLCKDKQSAEACFLRLQVHLQELNDKIGAALRRLDTLEDAAVHRPG